MKDSNQEAMADAREVSLPTPTENVEETEQILESMRRLSDDEARRKEIEKTLV